MIGIPFDKWDVLIALEQLGDPDSEEMKELALKMDEIGKELLPADRTLKNSKIASWHGITLELLINSPNYVVMCEQYEEYGIKTWVERMQKDLGLTEVQAWGIIAGMNGMLD